MQFLFSNQKPDSLKVDTLVINIFEEAANFVGELGKIDKALGNILSEEVKASELKGKLYDTLLVHTHSKISPKKVLLVGSGKEKEFDNDKLSKIVGATFRSLNKKGNQSLAFFLCGSHDFQERISLGVEAVITASFDPAIYKSKEEEKKEVGKVTFVEATLKDPRKASVAIKRGELVGEAINWARHLVSEPANVLTPTKVVEEARKISRTYQLRMEVLDEKKAKAKGMGAFCAIARGSDESSYMLSLQYIPKSSKTKTVLGIVGKGVTFDSGGLSIKPSDKMEEMKMDMAGAAAVLAVMKIVGELKPSIEIISVTPLTENLPSGKSIKPGDVVRAMNGKNIEVVNTDAEGRVVLADALLWAQEKGATHIVDLATLTGAVIVALGHEVTGIMGNSEAWVKQVLDAASESGEKMWQLPTFDLYKDLLKSSIADYANVPSSRQAGSIAGAMFLLEFIKEKAAWVHLDIAGTAWLEGEKPYLAKGPTGVGVKTLINLIKDIEK